MTNGTNPANAEAKPQNKRNWLRIVARFLIFALILGTVVSLTGMRDLSQLRNVNIWFAICSMILTGLMFSVYALRWFIIVKGFAKTSDITFRSVYLYAMQSIMAGNLFAQTASTIIVKSASLASHDGIDPKIGVSTVIVDKLFDVLLLVVHLPLFLLFFVGIIPAELALVLVLASNFLLLVAVLDYKRFINLALYLFQMLKKAVSFLLPAKFKGIHGQLAKIEIQIERIPDYLTRRVIFQALILSIIGELLLVGRSWLVALAVGLTIRISIMFMGLIAAQTSLLVAITPGGVGFLEGAWLLVFTSSGITEATIGLFFLLDRFLKVITNLILYVISLLFNR